MKVTMQLALSGNRFQVARSFRKITRSKDYGLTSNLKLTRVGFGVWHLIFDVEVER